MLIPAAWNVVVEIFLTFPTHFGFCIQPATTFIAAMIFGSENLTLCEIQSLYTVAPYIRTTTSSNQSVAGHPVAPPDPMPPQNAVWPFAAILSASAVISVQVFGTV